MKKQNARNQCQGERQTKKRSSAKTQNTADFPCRNICEKQVYAKNLKRLSVKKTTVFSDC